MKPDRNALDSAAEAARRLSGSIKEAVGKITGDARTEREGAADKASAETADPAPHNSAATST